MVVHKMGQYSDVIRTIDSPFTAGAATQSVRDSFDLATPSGDASHITHLTFFHTITDANAAQFDPTGSITNAISKFKLQVNGNVLVDYTSPLTTLDPNNSGLDPLGVLLQKTGGISMIYPYVNGTDVTVYSFFRIPLGIAFNGGQNLRVNLSIDYGAIDTDADSWGNHANTALSASKLQVIADYGIAKEAVVYPSSEQFIHSANATQLVTVNGNKSFGQMLGVMIANDTVANEFGLDGIRPRNGGFAQIPYEYMRLLNGDIAFKYMQANTTGETTPIAMQIAEAGSLWINAYRLTAGADFQIDVQTVEATTRYYFPVFVRNLGGRNAPAPKQNVQTVSSVTSATMKESQA
tara:strand:- start:48 stop:1097 length:1050 start_codon:yes stop_codon:yes gene_type:complete